MRIRKYYAPNPNDAFKQIRAELGSEAMILGTQKVKQSGLLGFLKAPVYEITVAIGNGENGKNVYGNGDSGKQAPSPAKAPRSNGSAPTPEMDEMKASIRQLQDTVNQLAEVRSAKNHPKRSTHLTKLRDLLVSQGLDEQASVDIMKQIDFELSRKAMQDWTIVREAAARLLEQRFSTLDVIDGGEDGPTVMFVVGPTGVGKTTTVAKLAALFASDTSRTTSLVTVDTMRIGAIPQLQAYADILGIPLEVVYSPTELTRSIEMRTPTDVIIIDTPGWSPRGAAKVNLPEFVNATDRGIVFLAISSTMKDTDAMRTVEALGGMPLHSLIITKVDETSCFGSTFNVVSNSGLPVTYITTGQNVPEDIEPADSRRMALRLLGVER